MKTLVIQTVLPEVQLLLLDEELEVLADRVWKSERDEVAKVLPEMEKMLGGDFKQISRVVVINGVGGFSSTRIGVTIANVLAMAVGCEIYEITWPNVAEQVMTKDLLVEVRSFFKGNPLPVKLAQPVYSSSPMISGSKKKKFV